MGAQGTPSGSHHAVTPSPAARQPTEFGKGAWGLSGQLTPSSYSTSALTQEGRRRVSFKGSSFRAEHANGDSAAHATGRAGARGGTTRLSRGKGGGAGSDSPARVPCVQRQKMVSERPGLLLVPHTSSTSSLVSSDMMGYRRADLCFQDSCPGTWGRDGSGDSRSGTAAAKRSEG